MMPRNGAVPVTVRAIRAGVVLAAALLLAGCASEAAPGPTTTSTDFADEEAAFAAAEETYRAYVDALNRVDLSDPATFEDVYQWTTGEALSNEKQSLSQMHADGWVVRGASVLVSVTPISMDLASGTGISRACVNVSEVALVDAAGESQVSLDRPDLQTVNVSFRQSFDTPTSVKITALDGSTEDEAC